MGNYYHPMGGKHRSISRTGCLFSFLLSAVLGGLLLFLFNPFNTDSGALDNAIADLETAEALLNRNTFDPNDPANDIIEPTLFPTPDLRTERGIERRIYFPHANTVGQIVTAIRVPGGWDITYLQNLVGHLEGTSWLGDSGNTVLAGHFEDQLGNPGPFRYLYNAEIGDEIIIEDRSTGEVIIYGVTEVFTTAPNDLEVLRHTENPRITLITCDNWNPDRETYTERVVVVAEPISQGNQGDVPPLEASEDLLN